jgi:nitrogen-specific signal transduction histidine kinase
VLLDEDGSPECMFGACQDVTDARRAKEESFARQKLESLGTLAGGIAHDFNNLLGAVLAQTELAMAELATGSHPDEELKAVRDVAIRGSEIVRQLMIYAGRESDVLEAVDLSKVIEGMLGLLKVAVSRHVALITNLGEHLPVVRARSAQLSQIVMNLVVNASEAIGDRDGVVRVTTEQIVIGPAETAAKALPPGHYVQLEVSDTGCGMSPETQAKVFDPFFTTKFSGRGLGLAVVQGIIRSLRGAIQVASEPGNGTLFQVLLPCAGAGAKADTGRVSAVDGLVPAVQHATALVVEDEEHLRLAVVRMLGKSGFEVFEAASGSAAVDLLRSRGDEIDLILLDLTIPGRSSEEVVAEAALARRNNIKVILTSAYSEEMARPLMDDPLVRGFIRKPFRFGDLVQTLQSVLFS